jgi:molybdate transport system substrate-binding protein
MKVARFLFLLVCSLAAAGCHRAAPEAVEVRVAAAADLQFVLPEIASAFEQAYPGTKVTATIGSSGNLYAQIHNGAQFDLFLSADEQLPQKLVAEGAAEATFLYALGRLVVWVPQDSPLKFTGLNDLTQDAVKKIAIANPEHAPYGAAAVAALKSARIYDRISPKLVLGENVGQAAQFLESGAADAGLISQSLATSPRMAARGHTWLVPRDLYPPLRQAGVVLKGATHAAEARKLRESLLTGDGQKILQQHGFELPP